MRFGDPEVPESVLLAQQPGEAHRVRGGDGDDGVGVLDGGERGPVALRSGGVVAELLVLLEGGGDVHDHELPATAQGPPEPVEGGAAQLRPA